MDQRLTVITLGVRDLARSRDFYERGLGWHPSSSSNEHIVFYQLGAAVLGLYGRDALAADAHLDTGAELVPDPPGTTRFGGVTLAQNVASRPEVDAALEAARLAGGRILKPAQDVFWGGYSGYFADPDGHPWEVAWNPHWTLTPDGRIDLPQ